MRFQYLSMAVGKGYLLNGLPMTVTGFPDGVNVELTRVDTQQKLLYSRNALARLSMQRAFCSVGDPTRPEESGKPLVDVSVLNSADIAKATRRMAYTKALIRLSPISPKSPIFQQVIDQVAQQIEDTSPPSPYSAYRWLLRYIDSGYNPDTFLGEARIHQRRKSRMPEGVNEAFDAALIEVMGENPTSTLYGACDAVIARVASEQGFDAYRTIGGTVRLSREPLPQIIRHRAGRKSRKSLSKNSSKAES